MRNCFRPKGYPSWKGQVLQADQLWALYEGLVENQLNDYTHLLTGTHWSLESEFFWGTEASLAFHASSDASSADLPTLSLSNQGYVNNQGTLETIVKIVKALKEKNPNLKYCTHLRA